jgi:hypothetical protein
LIGKEGIMNALRTVHRSGPPLPMSRHGQRPPVEERTNWDPWLPATEAYPEVSKPLRIITKLLLVLAVAAALVLLLASAAR